MMNISIPKLDNNQKRMSWCPRRYPDKNNYNSEYYAIKDVDFDKVSEGEKDEDCLYFSTISPEVDESTGSFLMDFGGRIKKNSKRNFQVSKFDDSSKRVHLQFGKV
mmetsp:Transcript_37904/g.33923  ORF Transcript_37904/g.33923 Transcript_37904/m.33923 type:complete len:106 (-) Transcript_37904:284-601(-)